MIIQALSAFSCRLLVVMLVALLTGCNYPGGNSGVNRQESAGRDLEPPDSIAGIEISSLSPDGRLAQLQELNPGWIRRNVVIWSELESSEGQREWSYLQPLENELIQLRSQGHEPILIVRGTPVWAQSQSGKVCGPINPDKYTSYATFLHDLVARYSVPPYQIRYWEIWNEPDIDPAMVNSENQFGCWGEPGDPYYGGGRFAEMLKHAYPAIKRADPQAQVLLGGLLLDCDPRQPPLLGDSGAPKNCDSSNFLEGVLVSGGGTYFDGVSFHAYDFYLGQEGQYGNANWNSSWDTTGPVLAVKVEFIREVLERYEANDKYLMNTEQALICGSTGAEPTCSSSAFEQTKAAYVVHSYLTAMQEGLVANIWYSLSGWRASGLLLRGTREPAPAFDAFKFANLVLSDTEYVTPLNQYPGLTGHGLEKGMTAIWVLWSANGEPHTISLPLPPTRVHDLYGDPLPAQQELQVGLAPVYVFWEISR